MLAVGLVAWLGAADELNTAWTRVPTPLGSQHLGSASFLDGRYFVFGSAGGAYSTDGTTWTTFNANGTNGLNGGRSAFANGVFVTGGGNTAAGIYVSTDGVDWSSSRSSTDGIVKAVVHNGAEFFAVSDRGAVVVSSDGRIWTPRYQRTSASFLDLAIGNGRYVAVGNEVAIATDGVVWSASPTPFTGAARFTGVAFGNGRFAAIAINNNRVELWHSTDGATWTRTSVGPAGTLAASGGQSIAFGGGTFAAAVGPILCVSTDGINWTVTPNVFTTQTIYPISIGFGNGRFFAAGEAGAVWLSPLLAGAPAITSVTGPTYVLSGQPASLVVAVTGASASYQWYRGASGDVSQPIAGATAATYTTPGLTQDQNYWVRVTAGSTTLASATLAVRVARAPALTTGTREFEVAAGETMTLSAQISGAPAPDLQWYRGRSGDTSQPVAGARSASLVFEPSSRIETYWLRATNMAGSVSSETFRVVPWTRPYAQPAVSNARRLGDLFVGVGGETVAVSDDDGRTWTKRATLFNSYLRDVAQAGGIYVAVGDRGFFSSPDLRTWTQRNVPTGGEYRGASSIAYGNGAFVAVGSTTSYRSTNGIDWSAVLLPSGTSLAAVIFDGRQFVAAGAQLRGSATNTDGFVSTSPDGATWTRRSPAIAPTDTEPNTALEAIHYAAGKYIAVGSGTSTLLVSPDAVNWSAIDLSSQPPGRLRSIAHANGRFVIATDGATYLTSEDGVAWTASAAPYSFDFHPMLAVAPSGELLAIGQNRTFSDVIYASGDSLHWTLRRGSAGDPSVGITEMTAGPGFVLGLKRSSSSPIFGSADGRVWDTLVESAYAPRAMPQGRGAFFNGRFHLPAVDGPAILSSIDGVSWRARAIPNTTRSFTRVVARGGRLFAFASPGGIATSTDGETWSSLADVNRPYSDVAFGNGVFVGAGPGRDTGTLTVSNDGTNWRVPSVAAPLSALNAVAFGNNRFLAVGRNFSDQMLLTSTDGEHWTSSVATNLPFGAGGFEDVIFHGDRFLIAMGGFVLFSFDGSTLFTGPASVGVAELTVANGAVLMGGAMSRAVDDAAVAITAISTDQEVGAGGTATLSVTASGGALQYQWFELAGGVVSPVAGASAATFVTPPISTNRRFSVRVTGAGGSVESRRVLVSVSGPPRITLQPFPVELLRGYSSSLLRVEVESATPVRYQWFVGETGDTRSPISGANAATLGVPLFGSPARFWVRASNPRGSTDSSAVLVTPWTLHTITPTSGTFSAAGLAYGAGRFLATGLLFPNAGAASGAIATSTDGRQWSVASAVRLGTVAYGNGRFVAVDGNVFASGILTSGDGVNWTNVFADSTLRATDLAFVGGRFVAIGSTGRIAGSADGQTWSILTVEAGTALSGIAHGSGRFVIGGAAGRVFVSSDGLAWSPVETGGTADVKGVGFAAGKFLATLADGSAFSSASGLAWSAAAVETWDRRDVLPDGFAVRTLGGKLVGRSSLSGGLVSTDGVRWGPAFGTSFLAEGGGNQVTLSASAVARATEEQPLALLAGPVGQFIRPGTGTTLRALASGTAPVSYQWSRDGVPIVGATSALLVIPPGPTASGQYSVTVTNATGSLTSPAAVISLAEGPGADPAPSRLVNLSILTALAPEAPQFKLGTVVAGNAAASKPLVVRAAGPSLGAFGIATALADPKIDLLRGTSVVTTNDNWGGSPALANAMAAVGAFPFASPGSRDALVATSVAPGDYVVDVAGVAGGLGTVLAEIYDATPAAAWTADSPRLINASVLKHLGTGLTAGFVIAGGADRTILIRAVGPGLIQLGAQGVVPDPRLELYDGSGRLLNGNNDWGGTPVLAAAFAQVGAFALSPSSADAALLATLRPGDYTVRVTGAGTASGLALIEIYDVR